MTVTRTTVIRSLKFLVIIVFIGLVVAFAFSRVLNYARGPSLEILEPANGTTISSSTVSLSGRVQRVNKLFLNGNMITTDEAGYWRETLIVFPGLNKITIVAEDRFDRKISKNLDLFGNTELP